MIDHEIYKEYGALAASGQLDSKELQIFLDHCRTCADCRQEVTRFTQVSARLFLAPSYRTASNGELLDRFKARALREGVVLRNNTLFAWRPLLGPVLVAFALVVLIFLGHTRAASARSEQQAGPPLAQMRDPGEQIAVSTISARRRLQPAVPATYHRDPRWSPTSGRVGLRSRRFPVHLAMDQAPNLSPPTQLRFDIPKTFTTEIAGDYLAPNRPATEDGHVAGSFLSVRLSGSQLFSSTSLLQADRGTALPSMSIAALVHPAEIDLSGRHYDFSANIRLLRFQLPTAQ